MRQFIILIVILVALYQITHTDSTPPSPSSAQIAQTATAKQGQNAPTDVVYITQTDYNYINSIIQKGSQSYPAGTYDRNIRLPSGAVVAMQITRTKTGFCPIRHEYTYNTQVQVKTPIAWKQQDQNSTSPNSTPAKN